MATIEKLQREGGTVYQAKVRKQGHRQPLPGNAGRRADRRRQTLALAVRADNETTTRGGARNLPIVPEALTLLQQRREQQQTGKVATLRPAGWCSPRTSPRPSR